MRENDSMLIYVGFHFVLLLIIANVNVILISSLRKCNIETITNCWFVVNPMVNTKCCNNSSRLIHRNQKCFLSHEVQCELNV